MCSLMLLLTACCSGQIRFAVRQINAQDHCVALVVAFTFAAVAADAAANAYKGPVPCEEYPVPNSALRDRSVKDLPCCALSLN